MKTLQIILIAAFAVMTVVGYASMAIDKKKAQQGKWRIKEATLFIIAFLLGGVGSTIGMFACRHKTQHWYFRVFLPVAAVFSVAVTIVGVCFLGR
jgi:Predicted membrane protein